MNIRTLLVSSALLPALLVSQTPDRLTGAWKGQAGPNGAPLFPIAMDLKLDGKGSVTGPVTGFPEPGNVKIGTFDATTGALKLQAGPTSSDAILLTFEGTVVNGVATGRASTDNGSLGTFIITKDAALQSAAQGKAPDAAAALRKSFAEVSGWVSKAADLVPADKYSYKPIGSVRSFGQIVAHVADSYNYYCARVAGKNVEWSDPIEKGAIEKTALVAKLKQAQATCTTAYAGNGDAGAMVENVGHTNLHYGNLITYIRMLGMTPPSS